MSMKNSHDTIGNRTRDLPVCSAVPQPTAPPRAASSVRGHKFINGKVYYGRGSSIAYAHSCTLIKNFAASVFVSITSSSHRSLCEFRAISVCLLQDDL